MTLADEARESPASLDRLVRGLFSPRSRELAPTAIGAELELIPVRETTHDPVPIEGSGTSSGTAAPIRAAAGQFGWTESRSSSGAPQWATPEGGRISYEPGGQIEISSPVYANAHDLSAFLAATTAALRAAVAPNGIELLAVGIDPFNDIAAVRQQLHAPRYTHMAQHFERIGPSGARMMRQSGSLQINVQLGERPLERWKLLNALVPYLAAEFANASSYAGRPSDWASYRAYVWRTLDPSRTGIPYDERDPVEAYARFASNATRFLEGDEEHLSTLFPEVRPRGYFEVRSLDSMEPARAADAIALVWKLVYSQKATSEALDLLGAPDEQRLLDAGRFGIRASGFQSVVAALRDIAQRYG